MATLLVRLVVYFILDHKCFWCSDQLVRASSVDSRHKCHSGLPSLCSKRRTRLSYLLCSDELSSDSGCLVEAVGVDKDAGLMMGLSHHVMSTLSEAS